MSGNSDESRGPSNPSSRQLTAVIGMSLCSAATGFAMGYSAPALDSAVTNNQINDQEEERLFACALPFGGVIGSVISTFLLQILGRKATILSSAPLFVFSYIFVYFFPSFPIVLVWRTLTGVSVGLTSVAIPIYLEEVLSPFMMRRLGVIPTLASNVSILVSYSVGIFLDWSLLALVGAVYSALFACIVVLIPESPAFYLDKGNKVKASNLLQRLTNDAELDEVVTSRESTSFKAIRDKENLHSLLVTVGLVAFQQFSAANPFIFFLFELFRKTQGAIDHEVASIIVAIMNAVSVAVSVFFVYGLGEKIALYVSYYVTSATLTTLGMFYYYDDTYGAEDVKDWLPLLCYLLHTMAFSTGAGPVPWLRIGRIQPGSKLRQIFISVTTVSYWLFCLMATYAFHVLSKSFLGLTGTLWIFALVNLGAFPYITWVVPKTYVDTRLDALKPDKKPEPDYLHLIEKWIKIAIGFAAIVGTCARFRSKIS